MAVRRPRSGLRKTKRGANELSRVKGIKSDTAWSAAMRKSEQCYVVVHILAATTQSQAFKSFFSMLSAKRELSNLVFAEVVADQVTAIQPFLQRPLAFPAVLVYHRGEVIEEMIGPNVGFTAASRLSLLAANAPRPGSRGKILKAVALFAVAAAGVAAWFFISGRQASQEQERPRLRAPAVAAADDSYSDLDFDADDNWDHDD